jgi:hypothetical protein
MRGVALCRANELFGKDPPGAEPALAERKRDFVVHVAQQLARSFDSRRPAEAVAWSQVVKRDHDDLLARETGERTVRERRDLRIWIGSARAGGNQGQAGYEGEASHGFSSMVAGS